MKINLKTLVVNGILAALYIAVTALIIPFGFTNIQFRVSEIFNHLIVFHRRYFWGIILGVFIANLFMSTLGAYEIFGLTQSVLSLSIVIIVSRWIKHKIKLMMINTLVFTFNMFIIAFMLKLALGLPFWITWLTTAIGEFVVMAIGIPIIYLINKRIDFEKLITTTS